MVGNHEFTQFTQANDINNPLNAENILNLKGSEIRDEIRSDGFASNNAGCNSMRYWRN